MIELLLDGITTVGNLVFWAGLAVGLVEMTGVLGFWPWAYRLGRRVSSSPASINRPPTPGESGQTRFAAFKVMSDGTCLFRRKTGFFQTAVEWKGLLRWGANGGEVRAVQPLGPTLAAVGFAVAWVAYGLNVAVRGDAIPGLIVVLVVGVVTGLSMKEAARVGRLRFDRYLVEVTDTLRGTSA